MLSNPGMGHYVTRAVIPTVRALFEISVSNTLPQEGIADGNVLAVRSSRSVSPPMYRLVHSTRPINYKPDIRHCGAVRLQDNISPRTMLDQLPAFSLSSNPKPVLDSNQEKTN